MILLETSPTAGDILTLLLGGGAVATISALFKGVKALQTGARARERSTAQELVKQRKDAWDERDQANDERDYWRNRAGRLEFILVQKGEPIPDFGPVPGEKKE